MDYPQGAWQDLTARSYERLLRLYPPRFRRQFSSEIFAVFLQRIHAGDAGGGWLAFSLREIVGLMLSILRERWHERRRKDDEMDTEEKVSRGAGGDVVIQRAGEAGRAFLWIIAWALLMTSAYLLALMTLSVFALPILWIENWGASVGLWRETASYLPQQLGMITGLALELAAAQWIMLRKRLPRPGAWFAATFSAIWLFLMALFLLKLEVFWMVFASFLALGLLLGLAQWLVLRRFVPNAHWLIVVDVLAALSLVLLFIQEVDVAFFLLIPLMVPGIISGLGVWLLLRRSQPDALVSVKTDRTIAKARGLRRLGRIAVKLAIVVAGVFFFLWVYAASHLAYAKTLGVYPTAEELIVARAYQQPALYGYEGVEVTGVENIKAGPNAVDGSQPFVWFGGCTINYDRVPEGRFSSRDLMGFNMIHVRDGWVQMDDIVFPWFLGRVMELYNLEGVRQFQPAEDL